MVIFFLKNTAKYRNLSDCSVNNGNKFCSGATGIEDRLQEGVPETIHAMRSAGIVIWVLTGDKPETAINVAYSSQLFSAQMEIIKLTARSKDAAENLITFYLKEIENSAVMRMQDER